MRVAAFNVENLFNRAKAFNEPDPADTQEILAATAELNSLIELPDYTGHTDRMLDLLGQLGLMHSDRGEFVILRRVRGKFVRRPRTGGVEIVAAGRDDWIGWVEVKRAPVNEVAVDNTGRVIRDVNADILAVVEADNRVALKMFSDHVLRRVDGQPYQNVMLIDGNDDRGIDVGLMTREGFDIGDLRSHVHDLDDAGNPIYSRDCPELAVTTPGGERIWILPNHFKSKFGGDNARSRARREAQARRTAEIYRALRDAGEELVIVLGDFNDVPDSAPLQPLLSIAELRDVSQHPAFDTGQFPGTGTFGLGNDNQKLDYLLLSPAAFDRVTNAGLFRKGAWPGSRPKRWEVYPELQRKVQVASDHHVIWADID